jgi:Response regulator containing CheY-like receiver domain and AraC-type DNA-binding domain
MVYNHIVMYTLAIIDDEVELREGLAYHFPWESIGFRVSGVFGGAADALRDLEASPPDAVLADIRMPFVSGLDLVRSLRARSGDRTIYCLLSAYRSFEYAQQAIELGVFHYLVKPTSFQEIREVFAKIKEILDQREGVVKVERSSSNPLIRESQERMAAHIGSCSLMSVARDLGISSSYLSRLFRDETGENFASCLQRMKMERAAVLLKESAATRVKDIYRLLGYSDAQSFCRRFKCHFGLTPSEFRKAQAR